MENGVKSFHNGGKEGLSIVVHCSNLKSQNKLAKRCVIFWHFVLHLFFSVCLLPQVLLVTSFAYYSRVIKL